MPDASSRVTATPLSPQKSEASLGRAQQTTSSRQPNPSHTITAEVLPSSEHPEPVTHGPAAAATSATFPPLQQQQGEVGSCTPPSMHKLGDIMPGLARQSWVEDLVREMWPCTRKAFERLAWESIPGILEESRPSWVHDINLKQFQLGQTPPAVSNIRVQSSHSPIGDEVFVEFDFDWKSKQDVAISIVVPRLPLVLSELIPDTLEEQLRLWLRLTVKIQDLALKGRARMSLRPMWDRLPVVGAVNLSLVRTPEFEYELSLGPVLATLRPLVKAWMDGAFKEMVLQPYTLPEHYFFQLDDKAQDLDTPTGVLVVKVQRADKVPKMDLLGWSDPFVEVYVRDQLRMCTAVHHRTRHPNWDETFQFPVHMPEHQQLTVILWDSDEWTPDDEVGRDSVALRDLQPGKTHDFSLTIRSRAELKYREEKRKRGVWQRVAMVLGRPFTKESASACRLHLQVMYHPLTEQEAQLVAYARQYGRHVAVNSPEAPNLDPHVHSVLLSGALVLQLARVDDLPVSGSIRTPYVKAVLRVGGKDSSSKGTKASSAGAVEFPTPIVLHLGPEETQDPHIQVYTELQQDGWLGAKSRGRVSFRLQEVVAAERMEGEYRLQYTSRGRARLSLEWKPFL